MRAKPISWYLGTLTEEQEDRVLLGKMIPGGYHQPCLVGLAHRDAPFSAWDKNRGPGCTPWGGTISDVFFRAGRLNRLNHVELAYDYLCGRYGPGRVNAMIRNRILRNRATRTLGAPRDVEATV